MLPQSGIVKYNVRLSFEVDGLVERADLIGAIFGQTEGLLGPEMNLNELQRISKVGRIEVNTSTTTNTTLGSALIPMSTDIDTCALLAAAIESIDKVGPFDCHFKLISIDDVRASKKDDIVRRAKEIKQKWSTKTISEGDTMLKVIHESSSNKLTTYGKEKLPCGPGIFNSNWIVLVEGRADVINLLRSGYDNAIAIEGAKIDESIKELCDSKDKVVAFLDGDRAGGFILKELKSIVHIDVIHRAYDGVEVEELTPQQIVDILKNTSNELNQNSKYNNIDENTQIVDLVTKIYPKLNETLEAIAIDDNQKEVFKVPISELVNKLSTHTSIKYLILDGIITQRLLDEAKQIGINYIVGHRIAKLDNSNGMYLKTFSQLGLTSN